MTKKLDEPTREHVLKMMKAMREDEAFKTWMDKSGKRFEEIKRKSPFADIINYPVPETREGDK